MPSSSEASDDFQLAEDADMYADIDGEGDPMSKKRKHHLHQNVKARFLMNSMSDEEKKYQRIYCTRCRECRILRVEKKDII